MSESDFPKTGPCATFYMEHMNKKALQELEEEQKKKDAKAFL